MSNDKECIFCNKKKSKVISTNKNFFVIRDTVYPVTKHHTLIITNRHVSDYFSLNKNELDDLNKILKIQKKKLIKL